MKEKAGDHIFLIILGSIILFGLAVLASASSVLSYQDFGNSYGYLKHQFLAGILPGIFVFFIASRIDYSIFRKYSFIFLIFSVFLLFLLFVPGLGVQTKGAARWLNFYFFTFQPSELLKLTFILYLAAWLDSRKSSLESFKEGLVPFLVISALIAALLVVQPDIGTLIVVLAIGALVYFSAGGKMAHLGFAFLAGVLSLSILVYSEQYRLKRWLTFLNPDADPLGSGYQIKQALIAIGSGGFFGLGFGMSKQKYNYLPEPMGDSVFAITAEEFGFVGSVILIGLFLLLAWKGLQIAKNAQTRFGKLAAVGITSWITVQAIINIGSISGLMPLTGITLPFISYGGSSTLVLLAASGILYNISRSKVKH
ncbi:putative lipid II flippase FtsW [Candidatus Azambacteria bacterium]|nr:putative lipid II flippase FtsW [Candidatus Azambacteria bacterium]